VQRQQLKWFAFVIGICVVSVLVTGAVRGVLPIVATALTYVPIAGVVIGLSAAVGLAILRYRLYDIDRLINRTLVYGRSRPSSGCAMCRIVGVHPGGGVGSGPPNWLVAAATLAAAAVFRPARRRIQTAVDRRFNRRKYNAATTIQAFSSRLCEQIDLDTLTSELLAVADQTTEPAQASLWLRPSPHGSSGTPPSQARPYMGLLSS
jgi:hypothetical protein